ncbi:FAD dependent oxidoreductase [Penicillium hordei]|uniref:FAD dependent oxidoreductase n=1 Tax=Penicillium hordei TaxID=40994 RepID=A0AAD6EBB7_9EURO|nr:FAD dependent oxidoreductase [Penicillium hordei]KAJ5607719.1 FAD dependent oxidoreductase [Penicillium hordei]
MAVMAPVLWALPCPRLILSAANLSRPFVEGSIETCKSVGVQGLEKLTPDQIRARFSVVTGKLDGWNINVWNPTAGWAAAGTAIERMAGRCSAEGGEIHFGEDEGECAASARESSQRMARDTRRMWSFWPRELGHLHY